MSRVLLIVFTYVLMSVFPAMPNPQWKIHTTFDGVVDNIFETPGYVYFTSRAIPDLGDRRIMSLFRYDKEGDEIIALSTDNYLTSTTVSAVQYCPQKGYVVIVGSNYDITLIYEDGKVVTIPDYRLASLSEEKTVNSITVNPWHDRIYFATNYGYVAVNDNKMEIAESRIYGKEIKSVAQVGDHLLLSVENQLLSAKSDLARFSLSDYEVLSIESPYCLAPVSENGCVVFCNGSNQQEISYLECRDGELKSTPLSNGRYYSIANNKEGVLATTQNSLIQINEKGEVNTVNCPAYDHTLASSSYNLSEFWQGKLRKGIAGYKIGNSGSEWTRIGDYMIPNAPSPFATSKMLPHPSAGVLATSYPYDYTFNTYPQAPLLISGCKDGWWTNYSPLYHNEERGMILESPTGFAIDPDNNNYIYIGSRFNGLLRLNLNDADDILHLTKAEDPDNGNPGFVDFVPNQPGRYGCYFSPPYFDNDGNLWTVFGDLNPKTDHIDIYCWLAADRKASTSSANIQLPKKLEVDYKYVEENTCEIVPLRHSKNKNILLFSSKLYAGDILLIDTKGTPVDSNDDILVTIKNFNDQDGNAISPYRFRSFWEDPSTGYVWVCHSTGVFYFDPSEFFKSVNANVYRVKVARNDGTNLADRLLDGAIVYSMISDGKGRKWFATSGGLVCTSSDGRTIEEQVNTSNSPIPSDAVYGIAYVPASNSIMMSTSEGIAEYFLSGDASASGDGDLKIYPNPVRPDYFGYVTIEGLPDRSIVKIVDASGNIVKEFGPVSGELQWDITNHQFKRVSSGVYFVLASAGVNENAFSTVGKILVVN